MGKKHRAARAAAGLEIRAKWAGPEDQSLTTWGAAIDAQTLANAAALVARGAEARQRPRRWPKADVPITGVDL